jgi:GntR family transcriptional regulator
VSSRPAHPPSLYQVIATELRTAIATGTLPPGTLLPTVKQLGASHHVSRCTAHRAITMLATEHLVTVSRSHRAIVNQPQGGEPQP